MDKLKRKYRRCLLACCILLFMQFLALSLFAQKLSTSVDRKDILIGEPIQYHINFTFPSSDYQVLFNIPDSIPHFYLVNKSKSDSVEMGNYLVRQKIILTSFDSGKWSIPSFPVRLQKGTSVYSLNTDPVLINVRYSPEDTTGLYDIKPPITVFVVENSWLIIAASILTLLVLVYLIWQYINRRKKREKPLFDSPKSAYREALAALEELEKKFDGDPCMVKSYHAGLSDILKRYVSRMQQTNMMTRTTGDLLMEFKENKFHAETLTVLAAVLRQNDAVKFAKYIPPVQESKNALQQLKKLVGSLQQFYQTQNRQV